ncbi:MAG: hypothetical protein NWQ26_00680, partial [Paraglaciecola sp.]|nr:hypothetical protein [Paraglaciecola sp.]
FAPKGAPTKDETSPCRRSFTAEDKNSRLKALLQKRKHHLVGGPLGPKIKKFAAKLRRSLDAPTVATSAGCLFVD